MKNKQGITIAALIIAIVGLSIGFAAFSNTLTISSSASVNPDPTSMNVVFSSSSASAQTALIQPTKNINDVTNFTATNATITGADFRTLNNVSAAFTAPGQSVTYNLYVYNAGSYKAYLNELSMGEKVCSIVENQEHPEQEATESLKNAACNGISISVSIDNVTLTSSGSLNNMELNVDSSKPVQIVISYASGSAYVDGSISVSFGNITFTASTVQGSSQQGGQENLVSPVAGTYLKQLGSSPYEQIILNNDGQTGSVLANGHTGELSYEYSEQNTAVVLDIYGDSLTLNYYVQDNNKVLYNLSGNIVLFSTDGLTGLTPLNGYTYSDAKSENSLEFTSSNKVIIEGSQYDYVVISNNAYLFVGGNIFTCQLNENKTEITINGNVLTRQN